MWRRRVNMCFIFVEWNIFLHLKKIKLAVKLLNRKHSVRRLIFLLIKFTINSDRSSKKNLHKKTKDFKLNKYVAIKKKINVFLFSLMDQYRRLNTIQMCLIWIGFS